MSDFDLCSMNRARKTGTPMRINLELSSALRHVSSSGVEWPGGSSFVKVAAWKTAAGGPGPMAIGVAMVGGSLFVLTRIPLQTLLGPNAPFIMAWPGILFAAFLGGFWPAIAVTVLSVPVAQWALATADARPLGPFGIAIFGLFGLIFAIAGEARIRGLRRAKAYADRLAETQAKLVQVARLNAVGEMAGTLAHELNQPLTAIANYLSAAQQLVDREPANPRVPELMQKAADQVVRAGQIVSRVRANVDRGEIETSEQSLSGLVQEAVDVAVAGVARDGVEIRYAFDRAADRVLADRIQVQQVVLNLVRNAVEAMAHSPRRELSIASQEAASGFLEVRVADTGPGIAPDVADRLFQPFVTGKSTGMGVGLSISRNIIEAHGGRMWTSANPNGGATFHFSLPRPVAGEA
jgi:signal transduction histidine kinase